MINETCMTKRAAGSTMGHVGCGGSEQQHLSQGDDTSGPVEGACLALLDFLHETRKSCVNVRCLVGTR